VAETNLARHGEFSLRRRIGVEAGLLRSLVAEIRAEAGITGPAIYRHFQGEPAVRTLLKAIDTSSVASDDQISLRSGNSLKILLDDALRVGP
jgi:hypothetical protein